eukprot:INCI4582.1.p1 GENE.INCI4582.1~~INCI4582.1.p1  ORF type:complete len:506 (-),score=70.32 INCI4582.1:454-1971(-)
MRSTVAAKALLQAKFQRKKVLRREGGISAKTLEWADAHRAASSFRAALSCDGPLCRQPSCPCVSARYLFVDHRTSTAWGAMESPFTVDAALAWVAAALYYIATGKPPADKQTLQLIDSLCGDELMASPKHETAVLRVEDACCAEQLTHSGEGDDSTGPAPGRQSQTVIAESLDRLVNQELATDGDFLTASVPEEAFPAYPGSNTFQVENRLAMGPVVARILSNARLWEDQRNPRQKTLCRLRSFSARLLRALRKEHATAMHADVVSNGLHRFRVARSDAVRQSLHLDAAGKATLSPVLQTLLLPAPVGWDWGQSSVDQTAFLVGVSILALVLQPTLEQSLRDAMEQLQTAGAPGSADDGGQGVDNAATTWLCDIRWQTLRSLKDLSHDIATLANTPETSTSVDANCAMAAAACTNINSCEIVVHSPKQLKRCFEKLTSTSASGVPLPGSTAFGGIVASIVFCCCLAHQHLFPSMAADLTTGTMDLQSKLALFCPRRVQTLLDVLV